MNFSNQRSKCGQAGPIGQWSSGDRNSRRASASAAARQVLFPPTRGKGTAIIKWRELYRLLLLLLFAWATVVATGCRGGGESSTPPEQAGESEQAAAMPQPSPPKPEPKQQKPEEQKTEQAEAQPQPIPENIADWVTDHYKQARKEGDPRLLEAVKHLGERFAGTPNAPAAARLLASLLAKTPEPEPSQTPAGSAPGSSGGPMVSGPMVSGPMDSRSMMASEEEEEYSSSEEEYEMQSEEGSGYPGSRYPGAPQRPARPKVHYASPELIRAIVEALGVNGSDAALDVMKQVLAGKLETDNDRVAMEATLETLAAHLTPASEAILLQAIIAPEQFRPVDAQAQGRQPGRTTPGASSPYPGSQLRGSQPADSSMMMSEESSYEPESYEMPMGSGYPGSYGMGGRPPAGKPLSADEIQQVAFALMAPIASEDFRLKLAQHLLGGNASQDDFGMLAEYLLAYAPENLPAQLALYSSTTADAQLKSVVEGHLLGYCSLALGGVLGIPQEATEPPISDSFTAGRQGRGFGRGASGLRGSEPMGSDPRAMGMMQSEEEPSEEEYNPDRQVMRGSMRPGYRPGSPGYGRGQPGGQAFQPEAKPPDPDLPFRLAKKLWAADLTTMIEQRVLRADSLEADPQTILLAGTVPMDSMRAALARLLQGHWQEGPGALESAGLLDWVVTDPGLFVVIKGLPRKEPEATVGRPGQPGTPRSSRPGSPTARGRYGQPRGGQRVSSEEEQEMQSMPAEMMSSEGMRPGGGAPYGALGRGGAIAGRVRPDLIPEGPSEEWMLSSLELLQVLCERFHAAADARPLAPTSAGQEGTQDDLMLELRPNVNLVAQYQVDLPQAVAEKLTGVALDSLQVRYVRMEETADAKVVAGFYRRKMSSPRMHEWGRITWIESLRRMPQTDRKRSVDVLITAPPIQQESRLGLAQPRREEGVPLVVEILSLEVKDPAPAGQDASNTTTGT